MGPRDCKMEGKEGEYGGKRKGAEEKRSFASRIFGHRTAACAKHMATE